MSIPAELAERARRHGLERHPNGWFRQTETQGVLVYPWRTAEWLGRGWAWAGPSGKDCIEYPTEADALTAALHWLDCHNPALAWRSDPSEQLAEAMGLLRSVRGCLQGDHSTMGDAAFRQAGEALQRLETLQLGPLAGRSWEELLDVAVDLLLESGELRRPMLRALIAGVQRWPELVQVAKVAGPLVRGNGIWASRRMSLLGPIACVIRSSNNTFAWELRPAAHAPYKLKPQIIAGSNYASLELAEAAMDHALREIGWSLSAGKADAEEER